MPFTKLKTLLLERTSTLERRARDDKKAVRERAKLYNIRSTHDLVNAYNTTDDHTDKELFLRWLYSYHDTLAEKRATDIRVEDVREYAELARVRIPFSMDRSRNAFYQKALNMFTEVFLPEDTQNANANANAKILRQALEDMNHDVIEELPYDLHALAKSLIQCIPADLRITNKEFQTSGYIFFALHRTLELLYDACEYKSVSLSRFQNGMVIKEKCEEIEKSKDCYRSWFHMKLVEQEIGRLNKQKFVPDDEEWCSIVGNALYGFLHYFHGFRSALDLDAEMEAFKEGSMFWSKAKKMMPIKDAAWYLPLKRFAKYSRPALKEKADAFKVQQNYDIALFFHSDARSHRDRKAFHFGMIAVLRRVAVYSLSSAMRADAVNKLIELSKANSPKGPWIDDPDIFSALLDAFHAVCRRNEHLEQVAAEVDNLFQSMTDPKRKDHIRKWLDNKSTADRLSLHPPAAEDVGNALFDEVRKKVGLVLTVQEMEDNVEGLKSKYKERFFSQVDFSRDRYNPKHVRDMVYSIVIPRGTGCGEAGVASHAAREEGGGSHTVVSYLGQQGAIKQIRLADLFQLRVTQPNSDARSVERVLLLGSPGSGKTCLARSIACQWAHGVRWNDLKVVYVIFLEELTKPANNQIGFQREKALESIIATLCYQNRDTQLDGLETQIQDDLDSNETLLIFDGLDNRNALGDDMLSSAFRRNCKLLLMSRPCDLHFVQRHVDLTAECVGLNDKQLLRFIHSEVPRDGDGLVKLLYPHTALWELAHLPMIAHILCASWKDPKNVPKKKEMASNQWDLYDMITTHMWNHLTGRRKELGSEPRQKAFNAMAELAFAALKGGKSLFTSREVEKASKTSSEWVLQNCGFLVQQMERREYQFLHPVFQEFFAGKYLNQALNKSQETYEYKRAKEFLTENKHLQRQKKAIAFMTEEFFRDNEFTKFARLVEIMDEPMPDVIGIQHLFAKLHILDASLSAGEPSLIEAAKKDLTVKSLVDSLKALIAKYHGFPEMREVLSSQLGKILNVLKTFPELVRPITQTVGQGTPEDAESLQSLIQIIAHIPDYEDWVVKSLEGQARHTNEAARTSAIQCIASITIMSSDDLEDNLMRLLDNGCRDESKAIRTMSGGYIRTLIGTRPSAMMSKLALLERERQILKGDIHFEYMKENNNTEPVTSRSVEDILVFVTESSSDPDRVRQTLRNVDLSDMFDLFWKRQIPYFSGEIARRSMRTALTLSPDRSWFKRALVSHSGSSPHVICERSDEDIKQLILKMHEDVERTYEGFFQIPEFSKIKDRLPNPQRARS